MELKHKNVIKTKFSKLRNKQDLIALINYVNKIVHGDDYKPLIERGFNYYVNPNASKKRYHAFSISKKSGEERIIQAPCKSLRFILKPLNLVLNCIAEPHFKAMGFVPGKSIADNAKEHVGNHYVYNIDLKDFFHSFDRNRVKLGFMNKPFNLKGELEPLAFLLASLCTHPIEIDGELKTVLPQGAPTSPTITNILCVNLDRRLNGLAKRFKINYSRYADDITFSSQTNVFSKDEFQIELKRIIEEDQNLVLNDKKTRLQKSGYRQEVTGLVVNEKVNVKASYVKKLRMYLFYWEKYGYTKASNIWRRDYEEDKGHVKKGGKNFGNVIFGKLEYLKMIKGPENSTYLRLKKRFDNLSQKDSLLEQILNEWEKNGIEKAMELYKA